MMVDAPIAAKDFRGFAAHRGVDFTLPATGLVTLLSHPSAPAQLRSHDAQCQLLRQLIGVEPLSGGSLSVGGQPAHTHHEPWLRTQLALITKGAPLLSVVDALQNVTMPLLYHHAMPAKTAQQQARQMLTDVGYRADVHCLPAHLTAWQRLQVALARALVLEPVVIALESPWFDACANDSLDINALLNRLAQDYLLIVAGASPVQQTASPLNLSLTLQIDPHSLHIHDHRRSVP